MKMVKKGLAIVLMTAVLLTVFTPFVVAEEFYTYNGHTYEQGIDRVECLNLVDESAYAELHRAVDAAVLDWDWHLGLLNEQYDVYWNLISYVGNTAESVPMIRFETMSIEEYESNMGSISDDAIGVALYYTVTSGVNLQRVNELSENWETITVFFFTDRLQQNGCLNDYDYLRELANHEIGHALGLAHDPEDCGVIMYGGSDDRTAYVPTAKDLQTIYYLYG